MRGIGPDHKDRAAAEKEAVEELKAGFALVPMEIKRGEMVQSLYPGRPERKTYRVLSMDQATGRLKLEVSGPDAEPATLQAVLRGDRLTLTGDGEEQELPMIYQRIDEAAFKARHRAAAESK